MTSEEITRNYFIVMKNDYLCSDMNLDRFINGIGNLFEEHDNLCFGQFKVPVHQISGTVHEFVQKSVSDIESHEMIGGNENYYLFKTNHGLYFHITWKIVQDMYEIAIITGVNYSSDEYGVYVFNDDEDASTVVSDDYYTTDFSYDSDDPDFDINDMSDL